MHITPFDMAHLFSWFWGIVSGTLKPAFDAIQVNALAQAAGLTTNMLAIALGIYGLLLMLGLVQAPVSNLVSLGLRGAVVAAVLTTSTYNYWIRDLVNVALPHLWGQITSLGALDTTSTAGPWDALFNQASAAGWEMLRTTDSWSLKACILIYFVFAYGSIGCGFGIWAEGAFMAAIYVAIGPLMFPLVFFRATRPIFAAWVGVTASSVVLQLLAITVAGVLVRAGTLMLGAVSSGIFGDATAKVAALGACALIFCLCARYSLRLPAAAAQLCGGIYWQPAPLINATYSALMGAAKAPFAIPAQAAADGARAAAGAVGNQARRMLPAPASPPGPSLSRVPPASHS